MGGITTRNMQSSLQKYKKKNLYIVSSCWTIIDIFSQCCFVELSIASTLATTHYSTQLSFHIYSQSVNIHQGEYQSLEPL
jgi:hypothetical protein